MQPLFGSETDGIQERKLVKRLLRKKKITFILTALFKDSLTITTMKEIKYVKYDSATFT